MSFDVKKANESSRAQDVANGQVTPGRRSRSSARYGVQFKHAERKQRSLYGGDAQAIAQEGVSSGAAPGQGAGERLPYQENIQAAFGAHDISGVRAHVGSKAAEATEELGALAYATGNDVAFGSQPDLHTAAHEAAHVVQQRSGVHLKGGVGEAGDHYEQHADSVADLVVQGRSAESLLGPVDPRSGRQTVVQRKERSTESSADEPKQAGESGAALINALELLVDGMHAGLRVANQSITKNAPEEPPDRGLVDIAASLVVGGFGLVVGPMVSQALNVLRVDDPAVRGKIVGQVAQSAGSALKRALEIGAAVAPRGSELSLSTRFYLSQEIMLHEAMSAIKGGLVSEALLPLVRQFPGLASQAGAAVRGLNRNIVSEYMNHAMAGWVNFKARSTHGAGKAGSNVATKDLEGVIGINQGGRDEYVDSVLQIDVFSFVSEKNSEGKFTSGLRLKEMRLDGVSEEVRASIRKRGTVGEAPINRLVRAIPIVRGTRNVRAQMEIPSQAMIAGADGQIIAINRDHNIHKPIELERLWRMVSVMPIKL